MGRLLRTISISLALALLATSITQGNPTYAQTTGVRTSSGSRVDPGELVTTRQIFVGVLFGQGPVARLFPSLKDAPAATAEQLAEIDRAVDQLSIEDPGLVDSFASAVQSGDRVRISAAVSGAVSAMRRLVPTNDPSYGTCTPDTSSGCDGDVYIAAAVFVFIVVLWFVIFAPAASGQASLVEERAPLARDRMIDEIARAFGG